MLQQFLPIHITPTLGKKFRVPISICFSLFIFQLFSIHLHAQQDDLLFNHLGLEEGLSEQTNLYVYKDTRGFVWISSLNGLNRFDGTRIKVYTPDKQDSAAMVGENIQTAFYEDKQQHIWFATYDAINCYHPTADSFSHYIYKSVNSNSSGYYFIHLADSLLWMSIEGKGLFTFNIYTKSFTFISALKIFDCNKLGYVPGPGGIKKIFGFDASRAHLEVITLDENLRITSDSFLKINGTADLFPLKIIHEGDSVVWIATKSSLIRMDMRTNSIRQLPMPGMTSIEHLNDSILLIGANENGVWKLDKRKMQLLSKIHYDPTNKLSLHEGKINNITRDRDGGIWMCSNGQGLSYTFPGKKKFEIIIPYQEQSKKGKFIPIDFYEETDGSVLCITEESKLYTLHRNSKTVHELNLTGFPQLNKKTFKTIKDHNNNIWLSTYIGLGIIRAERKKIEWVSDHEFIAWDALELRNGKIIVGSASLGLYEAMDINKTYRLKQLDAKEFQEEYLPHFQDSKGNIWASSHIAKVILVEENLGKVVGEIPIQGIICHLVESIATHTVWAASSTGLYEVDTRNYAIRAVHQESSNGCSGFTNMLQDKSGRLWLSCKNQVAVFDTTYKTFKVFVEQDGMPNTQFKYFGAIQFNDGEMWFPFTGGFIRFHPDQTTSIKIPAIPQITACFLNDKDYTTKLTCEKTNSKNITDIEKLTLPYHDNTIGFILNALEYSAPVQNRVRYKMVGVDKDWIETRSGTMVRYPALNHGNFKLLVQAANSDGIYSDMLRKLEIRITPPYYKTWWFISLLAFGSLATLFYIVYLRFSKRLALQQVRLRLYENLHDDVGSRLTAIVISAEELATRGEVKHPKLDRISHTAKSIVSNMRRLVWAIDPVNDNIESLAVKIRNDKSMILDDEINFHMDVAPGLSHINVPGEIRYQLLSIINEALANIAKYAEAKNVWVTLIKTGNILQLRIRDDGIGFDSREIINDKVKATGYGLNNMEKRIARIKGTLMIASKPGMGTEIDVKVSVRQ